ncbi:MAG: response regulator [Anaerolineales bacterium]|nr:MAG: response regulator [Anaerolineales bacterium]
MTNRSDTTSNDCSDKDRLLIVDDDPMTCQLLTLQLEMEGYVCATLSDPERALEVISTESPALVLVDFYLGRQDGLDLLRTVRNHKDYRYLPVVVMSGMDHRQDSELAGANDFVLKPFSLQDLVAVIQGVLGQQEA